jgi:hypothetical protein
MKDLPAAAVGIVMVVPAVNVKFSTVPSVKFNVIEEPVLAVF